MAGTQRDEIVDTVVLCQTKRNNVMYMNLLCRPAYRAELMAVEILFLYPIETALEILRAFQPHAFIVALP
jgi:hypothetical protein